MKEFEIVAIAAAISALQRGVQKQWEEDDQTETPFNLTAFHIMDDLLSLIGVPEDQNPSGDHGYRGPEDYCRDWVWDRMARIGEVENAQLRQLKAMAFVREAIDHLDRA